MITTGKVREVLHDDWSVRAERLPPATLWRAQRDLKAGFQSVADWYRQAGWLDC
jgi:dTDP-D-glucose 4,6-dehydratase